MKERIQKTDEELRLLALDLVNEKVFPSWGLPVEKTYLLFHIFMPLKFLDEDDFASFKKQNVVAFYEYFDSSKGTCINGYPIFSSFHTLTGTEANKLVEYVKAYSKLKKSFLNN